MVIKQSTWRRYIGLLRSINDRASADVQNWINKYAVDDTGHIVMNIGDIVDEDGNTFIDYCYLVTQEYGNASAAVSAQMYDALAEIEGANVPPAEMAGNASYHDVAKTVNGVLKTSHNINEMTGAVSRLVKKTGCDTTLQNAYRDRAQFAWIPAGDTCAFCLALASNGWVNVSARRIKKGYPHAEHIHSNCDCTYAIRFNSDTDVEGYDPGKYDSMFYEAEERAEDEGYPTGRWNMSKDNVNALRRMQYAQSHQ